MADTRPNSETPPQPYKHPTFQRVSPPKDLPTKLKLQQLELEEVRPPSRFAILPRAVGAVCAAKNFGSLQLSSGGDMGGGLGFRVCVPLRQARDLIDTMKRGLPEA